MASFELCFVCELQVGRTAGGCQCDADRLCLEFPVYRGCLTPCLCGRLGPGENSTQPVGLKSEGSQVKCYKTDLPFCEKEIAALVRLFLAACTKSSSLGRGTTAFWQAPHMPAIRRRVFMAPARHLSLVLGQRPLALQVE